MLTHMPDSLKSEELYLLIMQYLAVNVGKVVTPSLISKTINNCSHCRNATNKTVSTYLDKIVAQNDTVFCLDRKYVNQDNTVSLEYNRTYCLYSQLRIALLIHRLCRCIYLPYMFL